MKISKEKLFKLFEDGLDKIRIEEGDFGSMSLAEGYYEGHGIDMSFHLRTDNNYDVLGHMRLYSIMNSKEPFQKLGTSEQWQYFGVKYMLAFTVYSEISKARFTNFAAKHTDRDAEEFTSELSCEEFTKLAIKFKKMLGEAEKFTTDRQNLEMDRKLEQISDDFGLDFFPKKRKVIVEKTIKRPYDDCAKQQVWVG